MADKIINMGNISTMISLFGSYDENIKIIEQELGVNILNRDTILKIEGDEENVELASKTVEALIAEVERGGILTGQNIEYTIAMVKNGMEGKLCEMGEGVICISSQGRPIKTKTHGQKEYVDAISNNTIVFGVGPAGTGKTYLAVAMAVKAFRNKEVNKIILTRPAVEAGEKLGFLPGDLQTKIDPYLRPLYDALYDTMGYENYQRNAEKGVIEIAPLAYMRGRTLDNAFIILDEAQNTTPQQMKMFLTRIGFDSKAVITGDVTQIDLPGGIQSGLKDAMKVLKNIKGIEFCQFTDLDVVRHPLVRKIIRAYENHDMKKNQGQVRK
ncbi:MAG: PhoH family protein [Monoglobales bacterium]